MAMVGPSIMRTVRPLHSRVRTTALPVRIVHRRKTTQSKAKYTDEELAIPKERVWSVHQLLEKNSLQTKELSDEELDRLYRLAALQPASSEEDRTSMKTELREIIRLVDAVKHVDTSSVSTEEAMHSMLWPTDQSLRLHDAETGNNVKPNEQMRTDDGTGALPREKLLQLARRTLGKTYVVDRK